MTKKVLVNIISILISASVLGLVSAFSEEFFGLSNIKSGLTGLVVVWPTYHFSKKIIYNIIQFFSKKILKEFEDGGKYLGQFKGDLMHGFGRASFANGNKYIGDWKDNQRHGKGTYTYVNGDEYVGEFKNGKQNGQGTYTFADGEVFEGLFENDKFLGE